MNIKPEFGRKILSNLWQIATAQIKPKAVLFLLSVLFIMCEKDKEKGLDPEYGPVLTGQFGDASALIQEVSFNSKDFYIVGDLRTPVVEEKHPVIIMVHGSGDATRYGAIPFEPLIEIFLRNGFAVLSWDKPGSGKSRGEFSSGKTLNERASILADAVKVLMMNPSIDSSLIGLWGVSQAGWVMPLALEMTNDIAFMIVVSGGGEDGIEQYAYLVSQVVACKGGYPDQVEAAEYNWVKMIKATEYNVYREAAEILVDIPGVYEFSGLTVSEENQWNAWPQNIDAFFDPMDVIRHTTIPVLVIFGELDKNVDPVQGSLAYKSALNEAGNNNYMITVIQNAGHVLAPAVTGCLDEFVPNEYVPEYLNILESWLIDQIP